MEKGFRRSKRGLEDSNPYDNNSTDWDAEEYYEEEYIDNTGEEQYEGETGEYYEEEQYEGETGEYYEEEQYEGETGEYYEEEQYESETGEYYEEEQYEGETGEYYEEEQYEGETGEYYEEEQYEGETGEYYEEEQYEGETGEYYEEEQYEDEGEEYYEDGQYEEEVVIPTKRRTEKPIKEKPVKQKPIKEKPIKEKPVKSKPEKEKKGQADKHKASGTIKKGGVVPPPKPKPQNPKKQKKKGGLGILDFMVIGTGVAILLVAVMLGVIVVKGGKSSDKNSLFESVGAQLSDIHIIGENGIDAIIAAQNERPQETEPTQEETQEEASTEYDETDYDKNIMVKMTMASVQKDLKIKFSNKDTGKLVGNVPFSVEIVKPDKTKETWTDDDMDGVIYKKGITPGDYSISMSELSGEKYKNYLITTTAQKAEVKKEIAYAQVDVTGEGKTESEVNTAVEDTGAHNTQVESTLPDTVPWVESSQNTADYTEIDIASIPDPQTLTQASGFARVGSKISEDLKELHVGETFVLYANYVDDSTNATLPYEEVIWSTNNSAVATVSSTGEVKGISEGLAVVSYDATITLGGKKKSFSESCFLTVRPASTTPTNPPTPTDPTTPTNPTGLSISVNTTELSVNKGEFANAFATVSGVEAGKTVVYTATSGNESIVKAAVDSTGIVQVQGVSKGSIRVTISAGYADGTGSKASTTILVHVDGDTGTGPADPPTPTDPTTPTDAVLTLSKSAVSLQAGEEAVITATVKGVTEKDVLLLSCSDTAVATAKTEGLSIRIKAVVNGSAVLTVTCVKDEKEYKATCTIVVGKSARDDKVTKLKDSQNRQIYVMDNGVYREAVYADYYTATKFYLMTKGGYTGWQTIGGKIYYFDANGNKVTGEQVIQGARYTFDNDGALISGNGSMGIDVSKWNGKIDWAAVKNSGISYVIIRCGYRGSSQGALIEDSMFTTNIKGASDAGLKVGVYFFTQAVDEVEAVYEASFVIDQIKNYRITYPVFLDVEPSGGRGDKLDKATRTAVCKAFCETMQNAGYTAGVYANKTWFTEKLDAGVLSNYKIWLAQYAASPTYSGRYDIWQYKSTGRISGISGNVDLNTSYLKY